ncbi:MAG: hypothetical protein QF723_00560, partial [Phycisphaerales bacterium]|nr:hypothetical protein [Phycisphaerales bacterium]
MPSITRYSGLLIAAGVLAPLPGVAAGSSANITIGGVSHELVAGDLPSMFGEPGSFITTEDLTALNDSLVAAGIETVSHISLLLA